ncbi:Hypothetical protein, predicted transmembrane protein [Mycoplasma yeatsii 13926]|uniref:Transmembrane protein n=1 Tax=Mycoplasma yeatsii 13926 TaxID=1188240 RepID=S6G3E9_9MOLU|nr:hypothetical protein [Mycoplasma yeatsii]EOA07081.1 Hypothetical protein, predicted transmembrane protein [Mycoplasma yeatsii 13926]
MIKNSIKLTDSKSYEEITNLVLEKDKNKIITIYKFISLIFFSTTFILLLFLINKTVFYSKDLLSIAFNFSTDKFKEINWTFLLRLFTLSFLYLYGFKKAYLNIYQNKNYIKIYLIWFVLYLSISLFGFIMFFAFKDITNFYKTYTLLYSLIVLLVVDIFYEIFKFFTKRKTNPLIYSNKKLLVINILSRVILVSLVLVFFTLWIQAASKTGSLIINNSFYNSIYKIFKFKSLLNFMIIVFSFLVLMILLVGLNIYLVYSIIYKQLNISNLKNRFDFYLVCLSVIVIWLISLTVLKIKPTHNRFSDDESLDYLNLLFSVFNILIFMIFMYLHFLKKHKIVNNKLLNNNYLISFLWIIWTMFMISNFLTDQVLVSLINLIVNIVLTVISFKLYYIKNKLNSYSNSLLITINVNILFIIGLIYGLNHILLANQNRSLYILNSSLNINQIISITIVSIQTIYYLYYLISSTISINQIKKINI